jgi:nucleoside-diphosphate-sugar epimerase
VRKRALITGNRGFVGRHMTAALENRGWTVWGFDVQSEISLDLFSALSVITEPYDLVVHCAYHVGGRKAIDGSNINLILNQQLDAQLLRWAVETGQRHVLYFSSSAVYPVEFQTAQRAQRLAEADQVVNGAEIRVPDADYGWAKLAGERMVQTARREGLKVTVVRPFSGYGGDQSLDYPFPSIVRRAFTKTSPFKVWGNPASTRDWIHIDDVVQGALAVVDEWPGEMPVNLCTGIATSFEDLARVAMSVVGYDAPIDGDYTQPMGVMHRVGDPGIFHSIYTPKISIEEGVTRALRQLRNE